MVPHERRFGEPISPLDVSLKMVLC